MSLPSDQTLQPAARTNRPGKATRRSTPGALATPRTAKSPRAAQPDDLFNSAHHAYQTGRLDEAERLYRQALRRTPESAAACNNLGIVLSQRGDFGGAREMVRKAIAIQPDYADAHANLGVFLRQKGDLTGAIEEFRRAISLKPNFPQALFNLGILLRQHGEHSEALSALAQAVAVKPDYVEARVTLGTALESAGRIDEAIATFREATAREPGNANAHLKLAKTLMRKGKIDDSIAAYRRAITARPDLLEAVLDLGNALVAKGLIDEAVAEYRRALTLKPDFAEAQSNLGVVFNKKGMIDEAVLAFERAITLKPDYIVAHANLAGVLIAAGRANEAIAACKRAIVLNPNDAATHSNLGAALAAKGEFAEAISAFRQAVALKPDYAQAHANLGTALRQAGKIDEAIASHCQAIAVDPAYIAAYFGIGIAASEAGRTTEAVEAYRRLVGIAPDNAEAHAGLGLALGKAGQLDEAIAEYRRAISLKPDHVEGHSNLGVALHSKGMMEEAAAACERAIALKPDFAMAYSNLTGPLLAMGKPDEAIAACKRAIALRPNYPEAYFNLGGAFAAKKETDQAIAAFRQAVAANPDYAEAYHNLGICLKTAGKFDEAIAACKRAISIKPDHTEAYLNLGVTLLAEDRIDDAIEAFRRAIGVDPNHVGAHSNLGLALGDLGEIDEAITAYRRAVEIKPDHAQAHFNLSLGLLSKGHDLEGWREYEWRWKGATSLKPRNFEGPQWQGEDLRGKRLLLYSEQGLGDTLQLVRFVPFLAARGAKVILEVQPQLLALLGRLREVAVLIGHGTTPPEFDFHLPLMSVPGVLGTTNATIPADVPYLTADRKRAAAWRERIPQDGFRIGIAWQGNPKAKVDKGRSVPLRCFAPLAALPGARLISLQKNHGVDQLDSLPEGMQVETLDPDFDSGSDAFVDTAAVMMNLDLIITSDTSLAHVAGALGMPVWIALKHVPDWRWLLERGDSPWYPTARLFRQQRAGAWGPVFDSMTAELAEILAGNRPRPLPASSRRDEADGSDRGYEAEFRLAVEFQRQGNFDKAIAAYRRVIENRPGHVIAHSNLGVALMATGRADEAIAAYRWAIALQPNYPRAYLNLGIALIEQGKRGEAIAAYRRAIALDPNYATGHSKLGDALAAMGEIDGAIAAYQRAVALKPDLAEAHANLDLVLKRRNDNAAWTATSLPATATQIYAGFYINLDRSHQRKAEIEEQLAQYQLGFYARFPAADGNTLNFTNPYLTDAEIGCFTSHYLCLKNNLESPYPLHILEDDVLLSKYTAKAIDTALSQGFLEKFDVLFTDIWIPPHQQDYKLYIDLFQKHISRDNSGYITDIKFIALDLKSRVFAGTASFLVNNRLISKLHDLFAKELASQPRANVDLFLRRKAREGVLKLGCLFPFVTSIRLEHVIATTAIGRHDTLSDLACNIARHSFFVDHDLGKCQAYVTKFLHTAGNEHVCVLGSILGFALSDEFRPF